VSSRGSPREDRIAALLAALGQMDALSVLFSQAVADRAGINSTDLESLDLLRHQGPMTAGRLAALTGLTTGGAITALIDRLERLGYARRERDPADRRRVIVRALVAQAEHDLDPLYAGMGAAMHDLAARYSDEEIDLLLDFIARANVITHEQIAAVRGGR
jgi:DNA-binding MarR family transcriptional regulator